MCTADSLRTANYKGLNVCLDKNDYKPTSAYKPFINIGIFSYYPFTIILVLFSIKYIKYICITLRGTTRRTNSMRTSVQ